MPQESQPPDLDANDPRTVVGQPFGIWRGKDLTGKSGTGWVMAGYVFPDKSVVTRWVNSPLGISTTTCWDSVEQVLKIHEHGQGDTTLIWLASMPTSETPPPVSI
jgi:hypothetical protein